MILDSREEAGQKLALLLEKYQKDSPIVLGIPRGGVVVAAEVAKKLGAPLDVLIVRKIGAPGHEETAIGAVMPDGTTLLNEELIARWRIPEEYISNAVAVQIREIRRRKELYQRQAQNLKLKDKTVILADDGIATGYTIEAAIRGLRKYAPKAVIVAAAVAPAAVISRLRQSADEVVCLDTPEPFLAVGQFYRHFAQTGDEEVIKLLREIEEAHGYENM
ncbi:MAG TPA: phosphoribosyltransferase [Firmicutes bacterium]|nr:phosphoribosyltransferase [Bacillota bacterium]